WHFHCCRLDATHLTRPLAQDPGSNPGNCSSHRLEGHPHSPGADVHSYRILLLESGPDAFSPSPFRATLVEPNQRVVPVMLEQFFWPNSDTSGEAHSDWSAVFGNPAADGVR